MRHRAMSIATMSSLIGAILLTVSLLQTTPLPLRYASVVAMIVCEVVFVWAFMLLGARG